jgi:hypothetical protein
MEIRKHVNFRGGTQIVPVPARRKSVSIVNRPFMEILLTVEQRFGWLALRPNCCSDVIVITHPQHRRQRITDVKESCQ